MEKEYTVYILASANGSAIYVGMTANLDRRMQQHRNGEGGAFTQKYRATKLVYVERYSNVYEAIAREKQLKAGPRRAKEDLVKTHNPYWIDLYAPDEKTDAPTFPDPPRNPHHRL